MKVCCKTPFHLSSGNSLVTAPTCPSPPHPPPSRGSCKLQAATARREMECVFSCLKPCTLCMKLQSEIYMPFYFVSRTPNPLTFPNNFSPPPPPSHMHSPTKRQYPPPPPLLPLYHTMWHTCSKELDPRDLQNTSDNTSLLMQTAILGARSCIAFSARSAWPVTQRGGRLLLERWI
jgi:hypothetical protein